MTKIITTFFYAGLLPKAPGTWGSAAAIPFAVALYFFGGPWALLFASVGVFMIGWWATAQETAGKEDHDPGEIVIDEVAGQWIAYLPFAFAIAHGAPALTILPWPGLVVGFLLFRIFDIKKPWPICWPDQMNTPLGVMLDDVLAGLMAGLSMLIIGGVWHWMML